MGFNLYFAGSQCKQAEQMIKDLNCHRLLSYVNDKKHVRDRFEEGLETFIDCGAYSAFTKGKEIDIDKYIEFLNIHSDLIHPCASLDFIPKGRDVNAINEGAEKSWQNYLYMIDKLKNPKSVLPVFHYGEDFKYLRQILEYNSPKVDYMAFGGLVFASTKDRHKWIAQAFDIIKNSSNPDIKVHGFGVTNLNILETYPFYSADSTTWIMTGSNGNILTKYGVLTLSNKKLDAPRHISKYPDIYEELKQQFTDIGLNLDESAEDYRQRMVWNVWYLKNWADNYVYKPKVVQQTTLF